MKHSILKIWEQHSSITQAGYLSLLFLFCFFPQGDLDIIRFILQCDDKPGVGTLSVFTTSLEGHTKSLNTHRPDPTVAQHSTSTPRCSSVMTRNRYRYVCCIRLDHDLTGIQPEEGPPWRTLTALYYFVIFYVIFFYYVIIPDTDDDHDNKIEI